MTSYNDVMSTLIKELSALPGIGRKSAERIAFHILKIRKDEAMKLAVAIRDLKTKLRSCSRCGNISEDELCNICRDSSREERVICVVEDLRDLIAIEQTGQYRGVYHVLMGKISPLEGIGPDDLNLHSLGERVRDGKVEELIIATTPDMEGDGTAMYIQEMFQSTPLRISRIAKGVPSGSSLSQVSGTILTDAMSGRREM